MPHPLHTKIYSNNNGLHCTKWVQSRLRLSNYNAKNSSHNSSRLKYRSCEWTLSGWTADSPLPSPPPPHPRVTHLASELRFVDVGVVQLCEVVDPVEHLLDRPVSRVVILPAREIGRVIVCKQTATLLQTNKQTATLSII